MALAFHNTLTGAIAPFEPLRAGEVGLYVCGPTVYDRSHVGHARSIVFFDTVVRYLRFAGYRVTFVRNVTDIDDKIIARARERGEPAVEFSKRMSDVNAAEIVEVGCLAPDAEEDARLAVTLAAERPCRLSELEPRVVRFDAAVSALAQAARQAPARSY